MTKSNSNLRLRYGSMANHQKKLILFGAGSSAKHYIRNHLAKVNIFCCLDNDNRLWGSYIEGVLVSDPKCILEYEFDEVMITTQWSSQVRIQLIELGVPSSKIVVPDRRLLSPPQFNSQERQRIGLDVVKTLVKVFRENKLELVVDMGTLLGLYRDRKLIPWDSDIDFMLFSYDMENARNILNDFIHRKSPEYFFKDLIAYKDGDSISQIEFTCSTFPFDEPGFPITINARKNLTDQTIWLKFPELWSAPRKHFDSLDYLNIGDCSLPIPALTEQYLAHIYGVDWSVPRPSFTYSDYPNLLE